MIRLQLQDPCEVRNGCIQIAQLFIHSAPVDQGIHVLGIYANGQAVVLER